MDTPFHPKLPESTAVLREGDKFLFLVPEKPDWLVANENMASLLALCDGTRSLEELRARLGDHPSGAAAMEKLLRLREEGFFDAPGPRPPAGRNPLSSLHLNMTDRCNLRCVYCYASGREPSRELLSLDDYLRIIDDALGIDGEATITFTGGEPLLSPLTLPLAARCRERGAATFLLTNGVAIDESNADEIAESFDQIRVSVDGASPEVHDALRGQGSHAKTTRALALLEERGKSVSVAMTVTRLNLGEVAAMAALYGSRLTYQPLFSVGRARERSLGVDGLAYYEALKNAPGVEPYGRLGEHLATLRGRGCEKCAVGAGELSVSPSGELYPCHMLHDPRLLAGDLKERSLRELYFSSPLLLKIRSLSVLTREGCRDCPVRLLCAGGCWARAFHEKGELNASDSFCDYELAAFTSGLLSHHSL